MWICPTFSRPNRLAELAETWVTCERTRPLAVHVSKQDPRRDEYYARTWPESWTLFSTDERYVTPVLNAWWAANPSATCYGFIADDIHLRTLDGLARLTELAGEWFLAYPNDLIQRHKLCTHFCIGRKLVQAAGWFVNPVFKHHFIDTTWMVLGSSLGLARYCPHVIFDHQHHLVGKASRDEVYEHADGLFAHGEFLWKKYLEQRAKKDAWRIFQALQAETESGDLLRRTA